MKWALPIGVLCVTLLAFFGPSRAFAAGRDDGGADGDAPVEGGPPSDDGGLVVSDGSDDGSVSSGTSDGVPLACDGALCATVAGDTTCSVAGSLGSSRATLPVSVLLLGAIGLATLRRRAQRSRERRR